MYYGITTEFCRCNKSFVFANSETETCLESNMIHFPTTPPCSTEVDVLEARNVPILLSFPQMKNLRMTIELDPKGDKITCLPFGLYSSPAEYSTMGHIVLDLTILAYQPKSRERSPHPRKHVTFALSDQNSVYPAHTPELDQDDDDKPLVRPDRASASEDDNPLLQSTSRTELIKEKRESAAERSVPTPLRKRKGPPVWRDPSATLEPDVSGNSRERSEEVSRLGRVPDGEALRNFTNKLSVERNLRDHHLKHYHMSTAQFKKRTTYLDIPGKVHDLYQHVVKTCPFCASTKPRPDRSRVNGSRLEEFGDLIFLDHSSTKIGEKNLWISDCLGWSDITFNSISM